MLNLNHLYKEVFKPEYQRFDPIRNYYTIFMDTAAFAPLYPDFIDRIEYLLSSDAYSYLHTSAEGELSRYDVEEKLSEIAEDLDMRTNSSPPARRYCLLSYFNDEHQDVATVARQLSWLECDSRDVVTMMVCLSKRMNDKIAFLEKLTEALGDKANSVDLFIFTDAHTAYYRRALINSLCGTVLMNTERDRYQQRKERKTSIVNTINSFVRTLGEDGQRYMAGKTPVSWSSMFCKYYDRKLDFLHQYAVEVCDGVKKLSHEEFVGFAEEIYRNLIPHREKGTVKASIQKAVEMIPYVVPTKPRTAMSSLRNYLKYLYGERGVATVELTLKATLSGIYNYRIEQLAERGGERLMELCSGYAMPEWENRIRGMLDDYINSYTQLVNSAQSSLETLLEDDLMGDEEGMLERYLEQYHRLYETQKALLFWEEVRRTMQVYPERYEGYSERAQQLCEQMQQLRESIPTSRVYQYDKLNVPQLSAEQVLTMDTSETLCASIRALFNSQRDNNTGVSAPTECSPVFAVPLSPQFSRASTVELHTAAYTFCGCELNGQYFVPMEGEQDV